MTGRVGGRYYSTMDMVVVVGGDVADMQVDKGRRKTEKGGKGDGMTERLWQGAGRTIGCGKYHRNSGGSDMVSQTGRIDT